MPTFRPGDVIVANLPGAVQAKARPAVVISTALYHSTRPDLIAGFLTTQTASATKPSDHILYDWQAAGLTRPSAFRAYLDTQRQTDCRVIGHLSPRDWQAVQQAVRNAIEI